MSTAVSVLPIGCGGDELLGMLHTPADAGAAVGVLIVVGGPQYRVGSHRQFVTAARALAAGGYPVLRFDYRGMGDSAAQVRTFEAVNEDIRAAIDAFCKAVPTLHSVVLYGLCDAASAVMMYAAGDARVGGLIVLNPWARTQATQAATHLRHYYVQRFLQPAFWRKLFSARFNPLRAGRELLSSVGRVWRGGSGTQGPSSTHFLERMLAGITGFPGRVLVLISEHDLTAKEFLQLCQSDARWRKAMGAARVQQVPLTGADHTFSTRADLDAANRHALDWLTAAGSASKPVSR
ncbi:MAG TPA: hydrolase 1, exosortase A system-associated [Povalibacter sp.]|nr:hydrolase 1, exosortase A system-associated [Povalibacter sp.]